MGYSFAKQEAFLNARINEAESAGHGYFFSVTRTQLYAVADGGTTVIFEIIRPRKTSKQKDGEVLYHFDKPKKHPVVDTARKYSASCVILVLVTVPKPISHILPLSRRIWSKLDRGELSLDDYILPCEQTLISQAMLITHGCPVEMDTLREPTEPKLHTANGKIHAINGKVGVEADRESVLFGHQDIGQVRFRMPKAVQQAVDFAAPFFDRGATTR